MRYAFLCAFLILMGGIQAEIRSIWVLPWNIQSPQAIDQIVQNAIDSNQNELLIEVRYRSDALYFPNRNNSDFCNPEPRSYILGNTNFDPLEYSIRKAHQHGIRIQAWVVVYNATPLLYEQLHQNYIYRNHHDWLTRDSQGNMMKSREQYGYFLDPGIPGVQDYLLDVFSDIVVNYPDLDGFHLDYIRYPGKDWGHHPTSISRYRTAKISRPMSWNEWRIAQVTDFVQKLRKRLLTLNPQLILSAAVFPSIYEARTLYAQDWFDWLNRDLIDYAYPMAYNVKFDVFTRDLDLMLQGDLEDKIVVGLRAWNTAGKALLHQHSPRYNISHIEERISHLRSKGFAGIALFSYEGIIRGSALSVLAERAYSESSLLPELSPTVDLPVSGDILISKVKDAFVLDIVLPDSGKWTWELRDHNLAQVYQRYRYYHKGLNRDLFLPTMANGMPLAPGTYHLTLLSGDKKHSLQQTLILGNSRYE